MHEDKHLDLACWRINYSLHLTPHELYDYWQAHGTPTGAVLALKAAVEEIERLRSAVDAERERWRAAAEYAAHQLERARIWNGMDWHYNPLHPLHYRSALERLRDVLRARANLTDTAR